MAFNKYEYDRKNLKENYWHVHLVLPKGYNKAVKEEAKRQGLSVNAFIRRAIDAKITL